MVSGEVKKGEVYLYWIGKKEARGTEIKKVRPGVVISTNNLNRWDYRFIGKQGLAILDQIKTVDKSRLIKKLGKLTETEMLAIREKIDLVFD